MSRIITATHLGAVKGQGSVGPMQIANSPWVNVCVLEGWGGAGPGFLQRGIQ